MIKLKKWVKKNLTSLMISLSNVEKTSLSQYKQNTTDDINLIKKNTEGTLMDSLINGQVNQEVKDLRWRNYKIIQESSKLSTKITGYDDSDNPITKTEVKNTALNKLNVDDFDSYTVQMCFFNEAVTNSVNDTLDTNYVDSLDKPIIIKEDVAIVGHISGDNYYKFYKSEKPLKVIRNITPKFNIEDYTKKIIVRDIDDKNKLLELYVSKYEDPYKKTSRLFLKELNKTKNNHLSTSLLEIIGINFITYKTIGCDDFKYFEYDNLVFDKIIEFDGNYVIKFKANVKTNGVNIFEKYTEKELETKYQNKDIKKMRL